MFLNNALDQQQSTGGISVNVHPISSGKLEKTNIRKPGKKHVHALMYQEDIPSPSTHSDNNEDNDNLGRYITHKP